MNVVVVESPAKAKTINKYLGSDYTVIASYGHVRDLPAKDGSVKPDQNFAMEWEVDGRAVQRIGDIAKAVKGASKLYLATDPDREGEAISWHVLQVLNDRKALKGVDVKRVVFNEVTKSAVLEAFAHPREINQELVDAYLARRALDYLVGFTLSPVLWRKLPGSRSAGRVQSVALRLICEREAEIEIFKNQEYWSVEVTFKTVDGASFVARLTHFDGVKLERLGIPSQAEAERAKAAIEARIFAVSAVDKKTVRRHPQPPFTTSTLQQEASRKLGFGAVRTMKIAQRLYEGVDIGGETVGLISYMRTDGVQLSTEAITGARELIGRDYGARYLPAEPRVYKTRAKNAQEAHEAIRPTDLSRRPEHVAQQLEGEQLKLYELIWRRTVASQMESAVLDQSSIDIAAPDGQVMLRATGSIIVFDGFLTLYQEGRDDSDDEEGQARLPKLAERDPLERGDIATDQHFTQPPPRYSEASLVKKLEELGIGRPSTYASIIQVLQDRSYVRIDQRRFIPEDRGRLVTTFLASFFERYVEYGFTAALEAQLDEISGGRSDWRTVLREFWLPFIATVDGTKDLTITQVIDELDKTLGQHFFPSDGNGRDPRLCPACQSGRLGLRLGRTGGFIGCSNYPNCRYTRALAIENDAATADGTDLSSPKELGRDPATGAMVTLRKGPFGIYVQLGEGDKENKPKRASLPKTISPSEVTLEIALSLLALPREIGLHPELGKPITAGIGRFGPYLKLGPVYKSLGKDDDVLTIGLNRAVVLLAEAKAKAEPLRVVGPHPTDQEEIAIYRGRFGPFIQHDGVRATLPRGVTPETITMDQAIELLSARAASANGGKRGAKGKRANGPAKAAAKPAKTAAKPAKPRSRSKTAKPPVAVKGSEIAASKAKAGKSKARRASAKSADGG
jgi:DNA topoisomerase I